MADKFLMRCGLLAFGLVLAAAASVQAEPAASVKPIGQSLAISGKVVMAPSLGRQGVRNGHVICVCP